MTITDTQQFIPASLIDPSPLNPRKTFDEGKLTELAANIYVRSRLSGGEVTSSGVLVPLLLRPHPRKEGRYEIAGGERRWRAVQMLVQGITVTIGDEERFLKLENADYPLPALIQELSDEELVEVASIENAHRVELNELEEADSYLTLFNMGRSKDDIAKTYGVSFRTVERRLQLAAGLGRDGRRLLEQGKINMTQAFILSQITGPLKLTLLKSCREGMSVRELQVLVSRGTVLVENAIFDVEQSGLEVLHSLFDDGLPPRFADPKAALAAQIEAIQTRAEALEALGEGPVEIVPSELTDGLPEGYGYGMRGMLLMYNPITGAVREVMHAGKVKAQKAVPQPVTADVQPPSRDPVKASQTIMQSVESRSYPVKPAALKTAAQERNKALAEGMLSLPHIALANAIVQIMLPSGTIGLTHTALAQAQRSTAAGRGQAEALALKHAALMHVSSPGILFPTVCASELLRGLAAKSAADLTELLCFLTAGQADGSSEETDEYTRTLAELTGAQERLTHNFRLTEQFISGFTRDGLNDLIEELPENLRPIVLSNTGRSEMRQLLLERAERLSHLQWVPELVKFG